MAYDYSTHHYNNGYPAGNHDKDCDATHNPDGNRNQAIHYDPAADYWDSNRNGYL